MALKAEFTKASAVLARHAPEQWKQFLEELGRHADDRKDELVAAPLESLPAAQGRASEAVQLHKELMNAVLAADRLERRS